MRLLILKVLRVGLNYSVLLMRIQCNKKEGSSEEQGFKLENADLTYLGQAASVTIDKDNTTVVGGKGKKEDILKAIHYLEMIVERDYNKK